MRLFLNILLQLIISDVTMSSLLIMVDFNSKQNLQTHFDVAY